MEKMPANMSERIYKKVRAMANGESHNVKKLVNSKFYCLRVGKYRVIFDDQGVIIEIVKVESRGSVYKR